MHITLDSSTLDGYIKDYCCNNNALENSLFLSRKEKSTALTLVSRPCKAMSTHAPNKTSRPVQDTCIGRETLFTDHMLPPSADVDIFHKITTKTNPYSSCIIIVPRCNIYVLFGTICTIERRYRRVVYLAALVRRGIEETDKTVLCAFHWHYHVTPTASENIAVNIRCVP